MDNITRAVIEYVPNNIKKEFGNAPYLMNGALNFIKDINDIMNLYGHLSNSISLFSSPLSALGETLQHNKKLLQQAISKQYLFEQQLNRFLGRSINFAWADNKGNILFTDEVTAKKIYETAGLSTDKSKKYVGKVSASAVKANATELPDFVEKQFQDLVKARMASHQGLYIEILNRWKDNNRENNPWVHQHRGTVYWMHPPEGVGDFHHPIWSWSGKVNQGHISQQYINFIFNSMETLGTSESDIGNFMMGVQPNSVPGIVRGDVIVESSSGKIQIAVKSASSFNTASIGPYLSVAYQIIELFDFIQELTVQRVQNLLNNVGRYSEKVVEAGKQKAQEVIENMARAAGAEVI